MTDFARVARMAALGAVVLALVLVPVRALQQGWLPQDDARRHAAKAVSGKAWDEVLVLRPGAGVDQHRAWHAVLGAAHHATGAAAQDLVVLAVLALAWLFAIAPLACLRRPEAWAVALLLVSLTSPLFVSRWLSGRPLLFSMTLLAVLLLAWPRSPRRRALVLAAGGFAAAALLHGAWYLFAVVPAAFLLARRPRQALQVAGCWLGGVAAAALASGHPIQLILSPLRHAAWSLSAGSPAPWRVAELQPSPPAPLLLALGLVALALLAESAALGARLREVARAASREPSLVLAALGAALGTLSQRWWLDWGAPALAAWLALATQRVLEARAARAAPRLLVAAGAAGAIVIACGADAGGRWSSTLREPRLRAGDTALAGWLPEPGGVVYDERMADFYATFMENPHAPWRYQLGMEPALMPEEDLEIYRGVQRSGYDPASLQPWIERMRREDRMLLRWPDVRAPPLPRLEWKRVEADLWIGRKPS